MKILIAGSHGMIGSALVGALRELDHDVVKLVRTLKAADDEISWDPRPEVASVAWERMEGFDVVINVGGVSIGEKRWTARQKDRLWESRVVSTSLLTEVLTRLKKPPKLYIAASAVGFYGDRGDEVLTETSARGSGFLADLCVKWEEVTKEAADRGVRVVNIRSGIVLAAGKGVLKEQVPLFKLCLGGRLGEGRQYTSWISLEDEINAIVHIIENESLTGPVNLVSPFPVRNTDYTHALAKALNRPAKIPAPRWMISTALGPELTDEVLLASQNAVPTKLQESGFQFQDTELLDTLNRIFDEEAEEKALLAGEANAKDAAKRRRRWWNPWK